MAQDPVYGRMMGAFMTGAARFTDDHHRVYGWGAVQPWESRAACKDTDISIWFGSDVSVERGERWPYRTKEHTLTAKAICNSCPVLAECRDWAISTKFPYGVVAALTERERQRIIYGDARSATGVTSHRRQSTAHGPLSGRVCVVCSQKFEARRKDQRCCSPACTDFWRWKSARDRRERQRQAG